jgi:hypothetical protein
MALPLPFEILTGFTATTPRLLRAVINQKACSLFRARVGQQVPARR